MAKASRTFWTLGCALAGWLSAAQVQARIVERVIAVVGERPLLLTELQARARPFLLQLETAPPQERAGATAQLYRSLLDRMIDEELLRRAAAKDHVTVTSEEVDAAIERVAKGNQVTREQLLQEVERSGVPQGEYRKELQRQLLDAKVMNLRLQGRIRVSEQEMKAAYDKVAAAEHAALPVRIAALRLPWRPGDDATRQKLVAVGEQARNGADFQALVRQYSDDPAARESGGELPMLPANQMAEELSAAVADLSPGDVSAPIESGDALVIIKLLERQASEIPEFEAVRPQLEQRVQLQKMEKARASWLKNLRKTTHVEIRY